MYGLPDYGKMMADEVRRRAVEEALRQVITPGCRVVDLGCGLGIFTLMACRLGASHVDAIDPNPCLEVARQVIRDNGFADRVHCVAGPAEHFEPDQPADVLVADLRGVLPMAGHQLAVLRDARQRLLRPGGALVPRRDRLWGALVEAPDLYQQQVRPWGDGNVGFDFRAAEMLTTHGWCKARVEPEQLVSSAVQWAEIDYGTQTQDDVGGRLQLTARRTATVHGLLLWFDSELTDDVGLSNAPDQPELIYGSAFFPLAHPLDLAAGDEVEAQVDATLVGAEYVWTWATRHLGTSGEDRASFRQSTFYSVILVPDRLARQSADFQPRLTSDGEVDRHILQLMDGQASVAEISQSVLQAFPQRFEGLTAALQRVADLSRRYS